MELAYSLVLIALVGIQILLYKMRIPIVTLIWSFLTLAVVAVGFGSPEIPFSPYLQLSVIVINIMIGFVAVNGARN